jgi:hypothetical protein
MFFTSTELGIGDTQLGHHVAQFLGVCPGLGRAADVRFRHDLDQRHAGPVEVEQRLGGRVDAPTVTQVDRLAGVLLLVGPLDADPSRLAVHGDVQPAVVTHGDVEL